MGNAGAKMKEGFNVLGKKLGEGWSATKNIGKKVWDSVKSVPVLGKIAEGIEKYTPIGWSASNLIKGIDTGVGTTSKLLQGDIKGSVGTLSSGLRENLNYRNPLLDKIESVPVLGKMVAGAENAVNSVPIAAGLSMNDIRNIGNASLNAVDAFKEGDVKGGFGNLGKAGLEFASTRAGPLGIAAKGAKKFV